MNEPNKTITPRQSKLLGFFRHGEHYSISAIIKSSKDSTSSLATYKRDLTSLSNNGFITKHGAKRTLTYTLSDFGLLFRPFDLKDYATIAEKDKPSNQGYNFSLLDIVDKESLFTEEELAKLENATQEYKTKSFESSELLHKKELERFIIELSWKSSKIEGNTYTLLDTEKLLKDGIYSTTHTRDEATMILNHKKAFEYILDSKKQKRSVILFRELENIHRILMENLGVDHGIRKGAVGITGSTYLPLAIASTIEEQSKRLLTIAKKKKDPYSKALIIIACIGYLQPFVDGNKRTSRLFGNAILIEENVAPLSYRSVDEVEYREAMLVFYEQNGIQPFKEIFIEQYLFACKNYNIQS